MARPDQDVKQVVPAGRLVPAAAVPMRPRLSVEGQEIVSRLDQVVSQLDRVVSRLDETIDSLYDLALLQNADKFVAFAGQIPRSITPGTNIVLFTNATNGNIICHVRVSSGATTGVDVYLLVGFQDGEATNARSQRVEFGGAPWLNIIVPPNMTLFANTVSSDGSAAAVNLHVVPLTLGRGRSILR